MSAPGKPIHRPAAEIVRTLSLAEKTALLSGLDTWRTVPVPSADVPSVLMADGPHGLRRPVSPADVTGLGPSAPATCFPTAATLACSWDPGLAEEVGRALGEEALAQGVGVVLGPGLNLKRHPCSGRNFEYFSEDPLLSGKMAAGLVRGIQSVGVGACVKHFVANNQDTNRMVVDVIVDERTLRELYLTGFEIAVREGQPWAVMSAYNRINGEYCSESRRLLVDILRAEWGFDGLVVSDWGAVNDRAASVRAGLDLEMPGNRGANDSVVRAALANGSLAEAEVDRAAEKVVALALRAAETGTAASPAKPAAQNAAEHHALARRAAAESAVLLANDGVLPLAPSRRIAVIGAMAARPRYQGTGSSRVAPTRVDAALEAIRERAGRAADVTYAAAYDPETAELEPGGLDAAVAAARSAEVALVFIGLPPSAESEGRDREHMRLPEGHDALVEAVCAANARTVVLLSNGASVEMPWAEKPAAILEAYLGGQAGGSAIVDVLFGDAEPGGRLAETFPLALADVPADANFPGSPRQVEYREGIWVGYRYFSTADTPVRFPFGHGLSYTEFHFAPPRLSAERISAGEGVEITVPVVNAGSRPGAAVVQVYLHALAPSVPRPALVLAGFAKLWLDAGEAAEASVALPARAFAHYDAPSASWQVEGGEYEILVGASVADIRGRVRLHVDSEFVPTSSAAPAGYVADDAEFAVLLGRPVPVPEGLLPYGVNSTVADLSQTALGRCAQATVLRAARGLEGVEDALTAEMIEGSLLDSPLRMFVIAPADRLSWRGLGVLIEALNGRWWAATRRVAGGLVPSVNEVGAAGRRLIAREYARVGVQALLLFFAAGTLRWPAAWVYVAILLGYQMVQTTSLALTHPKLIELRSRVQKGSLRGDVPLVVSAFLVAFAALAGLDHRYGWSALPWWTAVLGGVGLVLGSALIVWAMVENPYFEGTARVSEGQVVCMSGPYRLVRHPGYAGIVLGLASTPLLLGSAWALVPAAAAVALHVVRTAREDAGLLTALHGYKEYAARTRYRLVPGVW
jgi:beta-glucosidase